MNQSKEPRREVWALCAFLVTTTISGFVHDSKSAMISGHSGTGKQLHLLQRTLLSPVPRDFLLEMQPTIDSSNSAGGTGSTVLRYKNLSQQEEQDLGLAGTSWVEQWFEDHLPQFTSWKVDDAFPRGQSKKKRIHNKLIETDRHMPGSVITHISSPKEEVLNDIEVLPHTSPMLFDLGVSSATTPSKEKQNLRSKKRVKEMNEKMRFDMPSSLAKDRQLERFSTDLAQLAVATASTIETAEQWIEFTKDTGGLKPILQCIHDVAEEIKGQANSVETDPLLTPETVDRFSAACRACRVLRDLCAKDNNWASAITDEIIQLNKDGTIVNDLVLLLSHTVEAERTSSKKAWRRRRDLIRKGLYSLNIKTRKKRKDSRRRCRLYISQLLLGMAMASDDAVDAFRNTEGMIESIRSFSSYTRQENIRRKWVKYPFEKTKRLVNLLRGKNKEPHETAFLAAASMKTGILGEIQGTSNKLLAALGCNIFVPKSPGQKGLRILCLDGGGTRGIASIAMMKSIVDSLGGVEVCDSFDMICGTSTGAIIAFLVGLRRESNEQAKNRYDALIEKIFIKSSLSTPMLLFTTASYSEVPFKQVMMDILGDNSMLDSRADPRVPLVFSVSAKMSSSTSKMCLFRNYNYRCGEKEDTFVVSPEDARHRLGFPYDHKPEKNVGPISSEVGVASRHEGSFRVLQRAAMRATTAAPTYFKPVQMGAGMYSDGGLIASNPAAVAIHEARTLYPDIPIEMVVSVGTGEFVSEKVKSSFGWDGIISQIVKSATDASKTHWVLEDILGQGRTANPGGSVSSTRYFRFDPIIGTATEFPIDGTDPIKLKKLSKIASDYMDEPEQQVKLKEMASILRGKLF